MLRSRKIAIAGSVAVLSLAAVPIAEAATAHHTPARTARVDNSRESIAVHHADTTADRSGAGTSGDRR